MYRLHGALMCFWHQITLRWQFHTHVDSLQAWVWAAAAQRGEGVIKAFFLLLPPPALQHLPPSPWKKKTQANILKVSPIGSSAAKQIVSHRRWQHKQTESRRHQAWPLVSNFDPGTVKPDYCTWNHLICLSARRGFSSGCYAGCGSVSAPQAADSSHTASNAQQQRFMGVFFFFFLSIIRVLLCLQNIKQIQVRLESFLKRKK